MPALEHLVRQLYNEEPSPADVEAEWNKCLFAPLDLGPAGIGILVEDAGFGGPTEPMLDIYVRRGHRFERAVVEGGYGPELVRRDGIPPDLIFGSSTGASYTITRRYRYASGHYALDACNDQERDQRRSCGGAHRTFVDPAPADSGPTRSLVSYPPSGLTGAQIEGRPTRGPRQIQATENTER